MNSHVEGVRPLLIKAKKIQLHSGMEGFESPEAFGIYRHTGGKPLGVVGSVYEPPDLNHLVDTFTTSIEQCCPQLDLNKLEYSELKEGAKVRISIPAPDIEVTSRIVGDVHKMRIDLTTGFDGLTKTSLSFFCLRLVCMNGMKRWKRDIELAYKNTAGNQPKMKLFCDEILTMLKDTQNYREFLNQAAKVQFTQEMIDAFYKKLLGYNEKGYKELTTRKRNILDKINASVGVEQRDLGPTLYALLNGVTRYTSHDLAGGVMDKLLTDNAAKLNQTANMLVNDLMYAN
jgi:hypothetical protein